MSRPGRLSRSARAVVAALSVVAIGLGVAACTGSDNGGVIQGPPQTTATTAATSTTAVTPAATTTTAALPGGTLPSS